MVSNDFKSAIKGIRYLHGKIIVGEDVYDNEDNIYIKPHFNTELFKTVMKKVDFETTAKIDGQQWVNIQIGVMIDEDTQTFEYVDFGEFYINDEPEWNMDTSSWTYKAYDKMIESMTPYQELEIEYPITYKNMLVEICEYLGWEYDLDDNFTNENSLIQRDLWKDLGLTFRDVLDDLCPLSMGNFVNDGTFKITYPNDTTDVIDEEWLNEDNTVLYDAVKPINSLVLSRAEGGDKIYRSDIEDDEELSEIEIKDNIILSSEYREDYVDEMFNFIKGFTYTPFEIETVGTLWFKPLDKFTIQKGGVDYETILLNYEIDYSDGLNELMFSPKLEEATTNYTTSALTDRAIKMATIIAYKNDARIELLTTDINELTDKTSSLELSVDNITAKVEEIDEIEDRVSTVEQTTDKIEFKVEKIGGQNLIVNSVGQYGEEYWENPHNIINGLNEHYNDVYNNSISKSGWEFMEGRLHKQIINAPQGTYTISAKFKKLLENAEVLFNVNGLPYNIENADGYELNEWVYIEHTFNSTSTGIEIRFTTDEDNSCLMTDLMLNGENIALTWQPANGESILGNTRIGINGVEVGDKSKENTSLTDTGLRMYYGTTEVGRSTATGMKANKYEGSSFDIGNVTLRDMGNINQTWLTRR